MRRALFALFALIILMTACSTEEDPSVLVDEADAMLVDGGIENSETRAIAEQKYDRAIRLICGEEDFYCTRSGSGSAPGTEAYNLSHAHFGLAFARTFDLIDRIRQLAESGAIRGNQDDEADEEDEDTEEQTDEELAELCEERSSLPQLIPLLRTIIDTSLLPIVENLKVVTRYDQFQIQYSKAFLDLSFIDTEAEDDVGIEFGTDEDGSKATFTVNEAYGALALYRVLVAGAEGVFSFNDLTQNLIVFLPKLEEFGDRTRPYRFAKLLNSDACVENPLFDASFGVLTEAGRDTFSNIETQLGLLFEEQVAGFNTIAERKDDAALLNFSGSGAWATNLLSRVRTGSSIGDASLEAVGTLLTEVVTPTELANLFQSMKKSLDNGDVFDPSVFVDNNPNLSALLVTAESHPRDLGVPAISFKTFFESPISDLKSIAPLYYVEEEPKVFSKSDCPQANPPKILGQELLREDENKTVFWCDTNGDMHWNRRGDFIVQPEREPFLDTSNTGDSLDAEEAGLAIGILGTFWDADANGIPDAGFEGLIPGATANIAVTAASSTLYKAVTTDTEATTLRTFVSESKNGCLDIRPEAKLGSASDFSDQCETAVGDVLGHVWPDVFPSEYTAPTLTDSRRRDPSNGVVDEMYMFFPNPSLNGVLRISDGSGNYRAFSNEDLNRFVSGVLTFDAALGRLQDN